MTTNEAKASSIPLKGIPLRNLLLFTLLPTVVLPLVIAALLYSGQTSREFRDLYDSVLISHQTALSQRIESSYDLLRRTGTAESVFYRQLISTRVREFAQLVSRPGEVLGAYTPSTQALTAHGVDELSPEDEDVIRNLVINHLENNQELDSIIIQDNFQMVGGYFPPLDMYFFVINDTRISFKALEENLRTLGLVTVVLIIIALLITIQLIRIILLPMEKLSAKVSSIGRAGFDFELQVHSLREMNILERKLFSMAYRIRSITQNLENQINRRSNELAESQENLEQIEGQLVESERLAALTALVSSIHHEVNTPLSVSITASTLLQEEHKLIESSFASNELTTSQLTEFLRITQESSALISSNLHRAVEMMRSFRQAASDQVEEKQRVVNFRSYLDEILFAMGPKLKKEQAQVSIYGPDDLSASIYPGALWHLVSNLILNCLIHAFEKGDKPLITIMFEKQEETLRLTVEDYGKGIAPDVLPHIFKPFFTTRKGEGGTGIGLHVVKRVVESQLRGTIAVYSELGKGTRFDMVLPLDSETA